MISRNVFQSGILSICLNASPLASSLKLVLPPFYIIVYKLQFHLDYLLHTLGSSTFGESQICCHVAEQYKVAVADATEWISNFGHQIQNLLENLIRMIYRSSTFGEDQISHNVAEQYKVAVAGATEWISNFSDQIQNLLKILTRMIYRSFTFGESQISCNVAEQYKVAIAGVTDTWDMGTYSLVTKFEYYLIG